MNRITPQAGRITQKILIFSQLALVASFGLVATSWSAIVWVDTRGAVHQNLDDKGYAINQYEPVGYFAEGKAIRGSEKHSTIFDGAKYAFGSSENLKTFLENPKKYKPEYGGYCAYGLVYASESATDPESWQIVDGRL